MREITDIEQAIAWFTGRDKLYAIGDKCARMEKIALSALLEKAEREKKSDDEVSEAER